MVARPDFSPFFTRYSGRERESPLRAPGKSLARFRAAGCVFGRPLLHSQWRGSGSELNESYSLWGGVALERRSELNAKHQESKNVLLDSLLGVAAQVLSTGLRLEAGHMRL